MNVLTMERNRVTDKLPSRTTYGQYPIVYYTETGEILCPECATEELDQWSDADWRGPYSGTYDGPQYADVLYEGIEWCEGCNTAVRGAYEPDADEE